MRRVFAEIDPSVRFDIPGKGPTMARTICQLPRIPHDDGGSIYAAFEDDDGHVCIGIAQDLTSGISPGEWIGDQVLHPLYRSIDRVDIFGYLIPEAM
jgi:hypothetical protein